MKSRVPISSFEWRELEEQPRAVLLRGHRRRDTPPRRACARGHIPPKIRATIFLALARGDGYHGRSDERRRDVKRQLDAITMETPFGACPVAARLVERS